jgi:hypothetical protein
MMMPMQAAAEATPNTTGNELQARSACAERVRRHRQRRAAGLRVVLLDLRHSEIEWLTRRAIWPRTGGTIWTRSDERWGKFWIE